MNILSSKISNFNIAIKHSIFKNIILRDYLKKLQILNSHHFNFSLKLTSLSKQRQFIKPIRNSFIFTNSNTGLFNKPYVLMKRKFTESINNHSENSFLINLENNSKPFLIVNEILANSLINRYNGAIFDLEKILKENPQNQLFIKDNHTEENFKKAISELLHIWKSKQPKTSITIKIPKSHIYLVEYFLDQKFYMHHCSKNDITLCLWLKEASEDKIPKYSHTLIGTGAAIFTAENKLILIREKFSNYNTIKWKFVTGYNDPGETIFKTSEREAKEETNLDIKFHGVIGFGEMIPSHYNCNEMCFFNLCSINSTENEIRKNVILDSNEVVSLEFFEKNKLLEMIKGKETTVFTEKVLNKLLPFWEENRSLEDNIHYMIKNRIIFKPIGYEDEINNRFSNFKVYY